MNSTDKSFCNEERELLRATLGAKLLSLEAALIARGDMAWNTVRLHFDNSDVDLVNELSKITVDEFGNLDEFGTLCVRPSSCEKLSLSEVSVDTTVFEYGKVVSSIKVANSNIGVFGDGKQVADIVCPQAIAFGFTDGEWLVLDKECWFSDTISIKRGASLEALIYDDSPNWEDDPEEDPTTHYKFQMTLTELG